VIDGKTRNAHPINGSPVPASRRVGRIRSAWCAMAWVAIAGLMSASSAHGADHLHLAPGLSFTDDSSDNFPIRGDHLDDAESPPGWATVMFFGAAHCWNTNREAERLVALYPKYQERVRFSHRRRHPPVPGSAPAVPDLLPGLDSHTGRRGTERRPAVRRGGRNGADAGRHAGPGFPDQQRHRGLIAMPSAWERSRGRRRWPLAGEGALAADQRNLPTSAAKTVDK
jgi:hypothetical protein